MKDREGLYYILIGITLAAGLRAGWVGDSYVALPMLLLALAALAGVLWLTWLNRHTEEELAAVVETFDTELETVRTTVDQAYAQVGQELREKVDVQVAEFSKLKERIGALEVASSFGGRRG